MLLRSPLARTVTALGLAAGLIAVPIADGTLASASPAAAAKPKVIAGPDISHYQHPNGKAINWTKVAKTGVRFAISKATEGTNYTDPYFASDYAASLAAGLVHGSYHFARPSTPVAPSAMAQAKYFATAVGTVTTTKTLPPALDLEQTGGLGPGQLVTWAQDFLLDMRTLTGRTPMLYTYPYFWENDLNDPSALSRYPLWMANFGTKTAPVSDLWQYTDSAHLKGIPDAVDESKFLGTTGFPWTTLSNGTVATPWKTKAPHTPLGLHASANGEAVTVSWMPGDTGTSRVTGYTVTASPGGAVQTVAGGSTSATFDSLSTKQTYTFTVTATSAVGTSAATGPSNPVTPTIPTVLAASIVHRLTFGGKAPLQTKLLRADTHAALVGKKVLIFRRPSASKPWRQIRKLSTGSDGQATATLHPSRSAELEAVFPGGKGVERSSIFENYQVVPTVSAALGQTTVAHGKHSLVSLIGSVTPFVAKTEVLRESLVNGSWVVLEHTRLGPKGRFEFTIHAKTPATLTYRIVVAAAGGRGSAHSKRMHLTIT